jgi:non-heme chloroperoxidase
MQSHKIAGGGGIQLHVVETGNPTGRPIFFIHGLSQCWLQWNRQLNSDLSNDYRLIAMDMRGHGLSDKPRDAYGDSKLWADDVNAVIKTLGLDRPVLSGWSYGPLVILDYIRHYGEEQIGGCNFIGGISKLGSEEAISVITTEFQSEVPAMFSTDTEESVRGVMSLIHLCYGQDVSPEELYMILGYIVSVPPYVRQAMFSRSFDNDDLLPKIGKPVLITHGVHDPVVKPVVVEQHKTNIAHAQIDMMKNSGHAPFWDDAAAFNRRLRTFCESV